ncbi:MAG TPA: hypothetical protein VM580_20270, partial [Labilithrix sp.]|nr:hypothetical protein [Labilithrix sp.]
SVVVSGADVVVVLVPDEEQASVYWHAIEPALEPGALLVFGHGLALETQTFEPKRNDVVLVTGDLSGARPRCRVAVHHDATGRALERALAYARAAFGPEATVGTTTVSAEVDAEIAALSERAGGMAALLASIEQSEMRVRDTHAPEEAKVAFYEGLRELVARRLSETNTVERGSGTSLVFWRGPGGGLA